MEKKKIDEERPGARDAPTVAFAQTEHGTPLVAGLQPITLLPFLTLTVVNTSMVVPGTLHCSAVNRTGYLMWPLMKTQVDCCSQPVTKPCAFGTPLSQKIFGKRGFMLNVSGVWHILTMEDG